MNRTVKAVAQRLLSPLVRTVSYLRTSTAIPAAPNAIELVNARSVETAADFIATHLGRTLLFADREPLWSFAVNEVTVDGLHLEFGVFRGRSINHFADHAVERTFHGFDSFEGLSHHWFGTGMPVGTFDLRGKLPKVRSNVVLHKGWFSETLPTFLERHPGSVAFLHLDADTEEVTAFILDALGDRLCPGSVLVFDEFFGFPSWNTQGEYAAWMRFCDSHTLTYSFIAFGPRQAVIRIDAIVAGPKEVVA
jgi:hypothetical protein